VKRAATASVIAAVAFAAAPTGAAPFIPTDDGVVLQTALPNADPRVRQMRALAGEFKRRPNDLGLAMQLANRQLAMGVAEADPRFVGYAEATLAPWWQEPAPAAAVLVLRARIKQAQHEFVEAASDLRAALRQEPGNLTALLVLASVDEVVGDFAEAKQACTELTAAHPGLAATACTASVAGVTGDAASSAAGLAEAVEKEPTRDRSLKVWALTVLAEIAARLEDPRAESYFEQARGLDDGNVYLLTVFADYLLDRGHAERVISLLRGVERIDALYLRLALAAQATGDSGFPRYRDDVAARLAAAQRQGDKLHLRDASRFMLEIERDGPRALALARQNWAGHKTPYDARALLAAAVVCHDQAAAKPVLEWVTATRIEDRAIERLIRQLTAPS
jgi:predicted Zn-dependent protease